MNKYVVLILIVCGVIFVSFFQIDEEEPSVKIIEAEESSKEIVPSEYFPSLVSRNQYKSENDDGSYMTLLDIICDSNANFKEIIWLETAPTFY